MEMTSQRGIHRVSPACAIPDLAGEITSALAGTGPALGLGEVRSTKAPSHIALVIGTSGTTGMSKEVAFTASALLSSARASNKFLGAKSGQQWSLFLPLTHIAAVNVIIRSMELGTLPIDLREHQGEYPKVDFTSIVPTQLFRALNSDERLLRHLQSAQAVLVGGAALSPALSQQAITAGINVVETYGMTETCGGVVWDGKTLGEVKVRIENPANGGAGRISINSPSNATCYHGNSEGIKKLNQITFNNGWVMTQDIGTYENATLKVIGRSDDIVVSGGVNVSVHAVENVLRDQDGVEDAVVFAMPDKTWGTIIAAVIVGNADLLKLQDAVEKELGSPAKPRVIKFAHELPLLPNGKIDVDSLK